MFVMMMGVEPMSEIKYNYVLFCSIIMDNIHNYYLFSHTWTTVQLYHLFVFFQFVVILFHITILAYFVYKN